MPVWKGQLGCLICNKRESTIHQITILAILTMLAVWVTLVALVSVLSCSVNSSWQEPMNDGFLLLIIWTKNEVISCGFDLPITDSCCSDSEGYTLYMSLGPVSICTSLQLRKLTHTKAENLTFPFLKLCISISSWLFGLRTKSYLVALIYWLLIVVAVTLKTSLCICRWNLWLFALVCSSVNSRTQKQKTWPFIDCILFWNSA